MLLIGSLSNGGAERSITNLANELSKYHNVILVIANNKIDYKCDTKILVVPELLSHKNRALGLKKLRNIKKQYKIDYCISYTTVYNFYNILTKYKDKTIISVRNHLSAKKELKKHNIFHKISIIFANKIVCCSKSVYLDQIKNYHAPVRKTYVIENFCNLNLINKLKNEKIKEYDKISLSKNMIVSMGRMVPHKGFEHIIKAMKLVVKTIPDCHLLIFSRGPEEERLKKLVSKLKLDNNIFFMGFRSNPFKFIKKSKAFVLASDYEGFPNVVIEAMSVGIPVIATDSPGGSKEILSDSCSDIYLKKISYEKYGILIPNFSLEHDVSYITKNEKILALAIIRLIKDKDINKHYKHQSTIRYNDYNCDKIIEKWLSLIK